MKQETVREIAERVAKMEAGQAGQPDYIDWIEKTARRYERDITESLRILEQAGFVVVPKEPTEAMVTAVIEDHEIFADFASGDFRAAADAIYRAMLSALTEETK